MNDIIFKPFSQQKDFLKSKARIRGAFAGKRCISPESKVLTLDGVKSFGDISLGDHLLSFDQTASQFVASRSTSSFPKTKCSGYRVIHEHGEFEVSEDHLMLFSDGEYRSIRRLVHQFGVDLKGCSLSLLSPSHSIEELSRIALSLNDFSSVVAIDSNVISIEKLQAKWWWDVSVEGTNNYFSEGAIHHNSGKTEIGSIAAILMQEKKPNWNGSTIDPYTGVIIAPTIDMTKRLSWKKFMSYARPFVESSTVTPLTAKWHDGSEIIGISADRPERLEGVKANWIWIDEVLQCSEQIFLECKARVSDSKGFIICTSSLGVQYINPKQHWAYKYFVESPDDITAYFSWNTLDNPYFPKDEIERLKRSLDPMTFRAMFELDWDTMPKHAVYDNFSDENVIDFVVNTRIETIVSIDWGFAHPMAVSFMQYDRSRDIFYIFDEIIKSRLTLDKLYELIQNKLKQHGLVNVRWVCDVAGNQEREQLGLSNVRYMWDKFNIRIESSRLRVLKTVAIVRSYVKNSNNEIRLYVHKRCVGTIDGFKRYSYVVKDGIVQNENPEKKDDDINDATRYGIINGSKTIQGIELS